MSTSQISGKEAVGSFVMPAAPSLKERAMQTMQVTRQKVGNAFNAVAKAVITQLTDTKAQTAGIHNNVIGRNANVKSAKAKMSEAAKVLSTRVKTLSHRATMGLGNGAVVARRFLEGTVTGAVNKAYRLEAPANRVGQVAVRGFNFASRTSAKVAEMTNTAVRGALLASIGKVFSYLRMPNVGRVLSSIVSNALAATARVATVVAEAALAIVAGIATVAVGIAAGTIVVGTSPIWGPLMTAYLAHTVRGLNNRIQVLEGNPSAAPVAVAPVIVAPVEEEDVYLDASSEDEYVVVEA